MNIDASSIGVYADRTLRIPNIALMLFHISRINFGGLLNRDGGVNTMGECTNLAWG
jgi:hypothetical protein